MGFWGKLAEGVLTAARRSSQSDASSFYNNHRHKSIGGRTIASWEEDWERAGTLQSDFSHLSSFVGLYRARLAGQIVYVGRAVEWDNGGLRKRLRDYTRNSDSSRKHGSGRLMNAHADQLEIEVLRTGNCENAAGVARTLEKMFVGKYRPEWNVHLK